jgi:hypothetical protein
MNRQHGVALSGLLIWCMIIALVSVLGMKVGPEYLEYFKVLKACKTIASASAGQTVPGIRSAFDRTADVDNIKVIKGVDLDISKEGNDVVISFAYESRIPLFANVSLLIDFQGSSSGKQ